MIVVGVDGSESSEAALEWALDEAELRGAGVLVLHAWVPPASTTAPVGLYAAEIPDPEPYRRAAEDLVRGVIDRHPREGIDVEASAPQAVAAEALVQAAKGAELLVVGSRGHGGFASLLLGSVSQQVAHHAECPVVIVRAGART